MRGKVVLITGSSSGIGAGVAIHFASLGCRLSLTGRNEVGLKDTLQKCLSAGLSDEQIIYTVADISSLDQVKLVLEKTIEKYGQLDVLINNAGISKGMKDVQAVPMSDYEEIMAVNLRAAFYLTQLAMPYLRKTKGNVVNVSSVAGHGILAGRNIYGVSKAALDHLTRITALDEAPRGVRVNTVSPGAILTPIWERVGFDVEDVTEKYAKMTPMGRIGSCEEIANSIAFLANNKVASFITGVILPVDGGVSLSGSAPLPQL